MRSLNIEVLELRVPYYWSIRVTSCITKHIHGVAHISIATINTPTTIQHQPIRTNNTTDLSYK